MNTIPEILELAIGSIDNLPLAMMHSKVVADRLRHEPFKEWITNEVVGYKHRSEVPSYRMVTGTLLGKYERFFIDITDDAVPPHLIPNPLRPFVETIPILHPIGTLATLPIPDEPLRFPVLMENEILELINHSFSPRGRFLNLWISCPNFTYPTILATVQQKLVAFLSELDQVFPTEADFRSIASEKIAQVDQSWGRHFSIGFVQTLVISQGDAFFDQSSRVLQQIHVGSWPSLDDFLERQNVDEARRRSIKKILDKANEGDESLETQGQLIEWIEEAASEMTGEVADVLKGATKKAATDVLVEGIKRYAPVVGQWAFMTAMKAMGH